MYTKTIVRRDADGGGHGGHGHAHAAPSSGYSEPAASYGAPSPSYGEPAPSYGAPSPSYGGGAAAAPATGYAEPSTGYGGGGSSYDAAPSYGGDKDLFPFDLSALIIPILAVIGLSLLFPTITSVSVKRRKRDLEDMKRGKFTKWTKVFQTCYAFRIPVFEHLKQIRTHTIQLYYILSYKFISKHA